MKCLEKVKTALLTVSENVWHYEAMKKEDKYIVWAEDSESNELAGDNKKQQKSIQGTIDLFTKKENDSMIEKIQNALMQEKISFKLNSVQYEDETKYIHYEWLFEVS